MLASTAGQHKDRELSFQGDALLNSAVDKPVCFRTSLSQFSGGVYMTRSFDSVSMMLCKAFYFLHF